MIESPRTMRVVHRKRSVIEASALGTAGVKVRDVSRNSPGRISSTSMSSGGSTFLATAFVLNGLNTSFFLGGIACLKLSLYPSYVKRVVERIKDVDEKIFFWFRGAITRKRQRVFSFKK